MFPDDRNILLCKFRYYSVKGRLMYLADIGLSLNDGCYCLAYKHLQWNVLWNSEHNFQNLCLYQLSISHVEPLNTHIDTSLCVFPFQSLSCRPCCLLLFHSRRPWLKANACSVCWGRSTEVWWPPPRWVYLSEEDDEKTVDTSERWWIWMLWGCISRCPAAINHPVTKIDGHDAVCMKVCWKWT